MSASQIYNLPYGILSSSKTILVVEVEIVHKFET